MHSADARIVFAFWLGVGVVTAALAMLVLILLMRQWAERKDRIHQRAAVFWGKILIDASRCAPVEVPVLARRDLSGFIDAWNYLHIDLESGSGSASVRRVAEQVGLGQMLHGLINHGGFHHRVMSIIAMGHLASEDHFDELARLLDDKSPIVSLSAARSLMQIDQTRAVQLVVPQIVARPDWVQGGIADILTQGNPALISRELGAMTLQVNDEVAPRLVRFLAGVSPEAAAPVIRRVLTEQHDEHLVSTCLQVMTGQQDLPAVRALLDHPRWHVRMHAASAMGRLGNPGDAGGLLPLLADAQWWVRYRAAQALAKLSGGDGLQGIRATQDDRFACDILEQVMAEQSLGRLQ